MDTKKIDLYVQLWNLGTAVCDGLKGLAKEPEDAQVFVDTKAGFQALKPYLSNCVQEAYLYSLRLFEEQPKILSGDKTAHPDYIYRPSKQRTFERCPICAGEGTPYFRAFAYLMVNFGYPHLPVKLWMKCGKCGNLYTWKYPQELLELTKQEKTIHPNPVNALTAVEIPVVVVCQFGRIF